MNVCDKASNGIFLRGQIGETVCLQFKETFKNYVYFTELIAHFGYKNVEQ